ncbi:hypothetical protein O6P43_015287 [Quillaja saponaria]|uniref:Uncharacterized protein n=1 Tax=Quillaja saponaria TaxID=32244 RepID=A0AAD7LWM9_QUISA|nr:hypothetical protein O6P43_015287 [Quillaja saponaria]
MPTFTAISLDRLLEPKVSKSVDKSFPFPKPVTKSNSGRSNGTFSSERKIGRPQIKPALYATPEPTPLPDSPTSFSPSPYIVNHKRRGPRLLKSYSKKDVSPKKNTSVEDELHVNSSGLIRDKDLLKSIAVTAQRDGENDDFCNPQELMNDKGSADGEDSFVLESSMNLSAPAVEFFDAWEELPSDGGKQLSICDVEAELREMRLSLLMEIEKKTQAEEAITNMQNQWETIRKQLSVVGLTLPADLNCISQNGLGDYDPAEELCQQFYIARFHYYETVNHEMFQRNQETLEIARNKRQRRERRQRWVWGCIASAITLGTTVLALSYISTGIGSTSAHHPVASHSDSSK